MAFVAAAPIACLANKLTRGAGPSSAYRGRKTKSVSAEANVSACGVAYFPFETEKEVGDWMERAVGEWWDNETI